VQLYVFIKAQIFCGLTLLKLYGPYHDQPSTTGFMRLDPAVLYTFIPQFLRDGWQVVRLVITFHACSLNFLYCSTIRTCMLSGIARTQLC